jgi:hypothetical protein
MKRIRLAALLTVFVAVAGARASADEADVKAVLEKAIQALGGEAKLAKAGNFSRRAKGTITLQGNDNDFTSATTFQGVDRYRNEFEADFNGNQIKGLVVVNGDKGWRKFGDNKTEMDVNGVANEKRNVYLQAVAATILPLKGKEFNVETAADENIGDKPAAVLKVTTTDGKTFTISFDKASGLPVRVVATVAGFQGQEVSQETTYSEYKDFDGIKCATKIESKRNGEKFLKLEVTDVKLLDNVDPKTFAEPE